MQKHEGLFLWAERGSNRNPPYEPIYFLAIVIQDDSNITEPIQADLFSTEVPKVEHYKKVVLRGPEALRAAKALLPYVDCDAETMNTASHYKPTKPAGFFFLTGDDIDPIVSKKETKYMSCSMWGIYDLKV